MGNTLGETMDREAEQEKLHQLLIKEYKKVQDKCHDLGNRSKRQSLRLVGIPGGAEGGNIITFVTDFLPAVLRADNFASPVVIDQAHRTYASRPTNGETPGAILVCLRYFFRQTEDTGPGKS